MTVKTHPIEDIETYIENGVATMELAQSMDDPTPRKSNAPIPLSDADSVRVEMAKVQREARRGGANRLDMNEASKLIYMLSQILKAIESTVIENRMIEIESAILKYQNNAQGRLK